MSHGSKTILVKAVAGLLLLAISGLSQTGEAPPAPEMPTHWTVTSDFQVPVEQVQDG